MSSLIGQSIGRYHILEQLGEGGMATVYKAFDARLEREVALKVILPIRQQSPRFLKRFEREAKALARLSHPNIVKIMDYGEHEGTPFLVMEFIPGGTLKSKLEQRMLLAEAVRLLAPIARALSYAHGRKIVHRDVKPSNILISESGDAMLSDFGVAKMLELEGTVDLTGSGTIGTPAYMSPEQVRGDDKSIDGRSDVYSLGVILFEALCGNKPFEADTPIGMAFKHVHEPVPSLAERNPHVPATLEGLVTRAMAKERERRFASAEELAEVLEAAISTDLFDPAAPPASHPPTVGLQEATQDSLPAEVVPRRSKLMRQGWVGAPRLPSTRWMLRGLLFVSLVGGAGILLWYGAQQRELFAPPAVATSFPTTADTPPATFPAASAAPDKVPISTAPPEPTSTRQSTGVAGRSTISPENAGQMKQIWSGSGVSYEKDPIAWSPDGSRLAFAHLDGSLRVLASVGNRFTPLHVLQGHEETGTSVAWSPEGKSVASTGRGDDRLLIWDLESSGRVFESEGGTAVDWSPDGRMLAHSFYPGVVQILDSQTWEEVMLFTVSPVLSLDWSPDSRRIAVGLFDNTVRIWNAEERQQEPALTGHTGNVWDVEWSPDGEMLASASEDRTIRIWDGDRGEFLRELDGLEAQVRGISWSPDGTLFASVETANPTSALSASTIRIWQVGTWDVLQTLYGHRNSVESVQWSPDGTRLASGGFDELIIWGIEGD